MEVIHPLTNYRKAAKLTQRELADKVGVARETIGRWETGKRTIEDRLLPKVSEVTGISKAELRPDLAELLRPLAPEVGGLDETTPEAAT